MKIFISNSITHYSNKTDYFYRQRVNFLFLKLTFKTGITQPKANISIELHFTKFNLFLQHLLKGKHNFMPIWLLFCFPGFFPNSQFWSWIFFFKQDCNSYAKKTWGTQGPGRTKTSSYTPTNYFNMNINLYVWKHGNINNRQNTHAQSDKNITARVEENPNHLQIICFMSFFSM